MVSLQGQGQGQDNGKVARNDERKNGHDLNERVNFIGINYVLNYYGTHDTFQDRPALKYGDIILTMCQLSYHPVIVYLLLQIYVRNRIVIL